MSISKLLAEEIVPENPANANLLPIVPDPNSSTQVITERNGINVVNIKEADSNKTSHNLYSDFNINPQGLILNNSSNTADGIINTDLAGWIKNNPNLANSGSANLIINEVNGNDISRLLGFLEVAGQKADVIIANPNGLVVNNAGFINIGNISLINGKPVNDNSQLIFNLENSDKIALDSAIPYWQKITVEGQGIDFSRNQIAQLISQHLKIDGPIYASPTTSLNLLTGNYRYNPNNQTLSSLTCLNLTDCPNIPLDALAIDASNLAKIQAGKIYMVATQQGFAVRWLGDMIASQNGIEIDASGNVTYGNMVVNNGNTSITSNNGKIIGQGILQSKKLSQDDNVNLENYNITLKANDNIELSSLARLLSASKIKIESAKNIILNGSQSSIADNDFLIIAKDIENNAKLIAYNNLTLNSTNLNNSSEILAKNIIDLTLTNKITNSGLIQGQEQVLIKALNLQNNNDDDSVSGKIYGNKIVKINLELTDQQIEQLPQDQNFIQNLKGEIKAQDNIEIKGYNIANQASIITDKDLTIIAKNNFTNNSILSAKSNLSITTTLGNLINDNLGQIIADNLINLLVENNFTNNNKISAKQNLNITTNLGDVTNAINAQIISGNDLTLNAQNNLVNNSELSAQNNIDLSIAVNDFTNSSTAKIIAGNDLQILVKNSIENNGILSAKNNITLTAIDNNFTSQNTSQIISDNDITITANNNINNSGVISAKKNITLESLTGNIENNNIGEIIAGVKDQVEQTSLITLSATQGNIAQNSSKGIVGNKDLIINANNFTNNFRLDVANNLIFNIANNLINSTNAVIHSDGNIELNVVNQLVNNSFAKIFAKNDLKIQKYAIDNPLQLTNNKVELVQNNSGELTSFNGETIINAKKLENQRTIKPAIALIQGDDYVAGSLLQNHQQYSWILDPSLCSSGLCSTGVSKYRATIPTNSESKIAWIRANTQLTLNIDEIINEASSIISKGNMEINAQILNNQSLNYNAKIYQKTVNEAGEVSDNQYFDDLDNNRSFNALLRYGNTITKNISEDNSNTSIVRDFSNFLVENIANNDVKISLNKLSSFDSFQADFALTLSQGDLSDIKNSQDALSYQSASDLNITLIEPKTATAQVVNIVENPLNYSKENRQEFINKQILINILNPDAIQENQSLNQENSQQNTNQEINNNNQNIIYANNLCNQDLSIINSCNQNSKINSEIENLVINDFQKQFEQQSKNLVGDQYLQSSRSHEQIANIEKNNSSFIQSTYNQVAENIAKIEEKNNQIANNMIVDLKNKIARSNAVIQSIEQNDQKNSDLVKIKTFEENFLTSKVKQISKNTKDIINSLASSNQEDVIQNIENTQAKSVSAISPSGIGKAIVQSVTPVISTGSKISKAIIEKTLGIKTINMPSVNGLQAKAKNLNEENLKQILLNKTQNFQTNQSIGIIKNESEINPQF